MLNKESHQNSDWLSSYVRRKRLRITSASNLRQRLCNWVTRSDVRNKNKSRKGNRIIRCRSFSGKDQYFIKRLSRQVQIVLWPKQWQLYASLNEICFRSYVISITFSVKLVHIFVRQWILIIAKTVLKTCSSVTNANWKYFSREIRFFAGIESNENREKIGATQFCILSKSNGHDFCNNFIYFANGLFIINAMNTKNKNLLARASMHMYIQTQFVYKY